MNFVPYIPTSEYAIYGIPDAVPAQVKSASMTVNTFLSRREGLLWSPDANGLPAYMTNLTPSLSVDLPSPITPGSNVVITFPNQRFGIQNIGEVVILDRNNSNSTEACIVTEASGNSLTLSAAKFAHSSSTKMDFGLTILQELPVPSKRTTVRVSQSPLVRLMSGFGRYGYGRRSDQFAGPSINTNLLAYVAAFGGPPMWTQFPIEETDVNTQTGEVWIPPGLLLAYFTDVRLRYVAGWSQASLPPDIKQAVANIVRASIDSPLASNVKMMKTGDTTIERFSASAIDADTKALLQPYKPFLMA